MVLQHFFSDSEVNVLDKHTTFIRVVSCLGLVSYSNFSWLKVFLILGRSSDGAILGFGFIKLSF